MKTKLWALACILSFFPLSRIQSQVQTIDLFNGKDLGNWDFVLQNDTKKANEVFTVKDGVIHIAGTPFGYMYTKEKYNNFHLHVEWRWPMEATNSGIFLYVQDDNKVWPNAIECQLKAGNAGDFVLLNGSDLAEFVLKTGETRPAFPVVKSKQISSEMTPGEWNNADITCENGNITVYINGVFQNQGTRSLHKSGHIALQSEGKDIQFRNVRVTPLGSFQYTNPVVMENVPDPSLIKAKDGNYYLYCTEHRGEVPIYRSSDLVHWNRAGSAFTKEGRPNFEPNAGIWAPDINYINGKYVLYYSMSTWGGVKTCGIGVAVSDKPEGPFIDKGMLFRSSTIGVTNSIDEYYMEDKGKKYLFWGSFFGIYGIELSDDGLSLKPGAEKKQVAGTAYEGTYIHKRGKFYYLFASTGTCCEGVKSTYTTVVGRSESLFGPYMDKSGQSMMDNHHEILIHKSDLFVGVGHNSEIVTDKAGNDWIFYHGFDLNNSAGRRLFLDKVTWKNGWPEVENAMPSTIASSPVF